MAAFDFRGVVASVVVSVVASVVVSVVAVASAPRTPDARALSRCSIRANAPTSEFSAAGTRSRAAMISSRRRGAVAPLSSPRERLMTSAALLASAGPSSSACATICRASSSGVSRSPRCTASGTLCTTITSRMRSSRSETKRRGSCPLSTTPSTTSNNAAPSRFAIASMVASSTALSVTPNWPATSAYVTPSVPEPAITWPRIDSESRTLPAPARATKARADGSADTPSASQIEARSC